eukprot:gb/GEZN01010338.1/.p1 GENE.gb/GEZN01010338.1/~~gb/GEZN01010338.1/.p1  ORF type:complete len:254 (+),score=18.15 gb/GEZN01010338.1/:321-1082(+)
MQEAATAQAFTSLPGINQQAQPQQGGRLRPTLPRWPLLPLLPRCLPLCLSLRHQLLSTRKDRRRRTRHTKKSEACQTRVHHTGRRVRPPSPLPLLAALPPLPLCNKAHSARGVGTLCLSLLCYLAQLLLVISKIRKKINTIRLPPRSASRTRRKKFVPTVSPPCRMTAKKRPQKQLPLHQKHSSGGVRRCGSGWLDVIHPRHRTSLHQPLLLAPPRMATQQESHLGRQARLQQRSWDLVLREGQTRPHQLQGE